MTLSTGEKEEVEENRYEKCLSCSHVRQNHMKGAGLCLIKRCFCFGAWSSEITSREEEEK